MWHPACYALGKNNKLMWRNYFITAMRNIKSRQVPSFIIVIGLVAGLTVSFLIMLTLHHELSYEETHQKAKRVYRITAHYKMWDQHSGGMSYMMKDQVLGTIPGIENSARFATLGNVTLNPDKNPLNVENAYYAESEVFDLFTVELLSGTPEALDKENQVLLSKSRAEQLFPASNPLGKQINVRPEGDTTLIMNVAGVYKDLPSNTVFRPEILMNLSACWARIANSMVSTRQMSTEQVIHYLKTRPRRGLFHTYILARPTASASQIETAIHDEMVKHLPEHYKMAYQAIPLKNVLFESSNIQNNHFTPGNAKILFIFGAVALAVLLIASLNFIILNLAAQSYRTREIGLRKVMGATAPNIRKQLIMEALLLSLLSTPFALILTEQFLPVLNAFLDKTIEIDYTGDLPLFAGFLMVSILVGIIPGFIISLKTSKTNPAVIFRGQMTAGKSRNYFQKGLIVFQFIIFIILLVSTFVIRKQLHYAKQEHLPAKNSYVLQLELKPSAQESHYKTLKQKIAQIPGVEDISGTVWTPPSNNDLNINIEHPKTGEEINFHGLWVDSRFTAMMEIELLQGEGFWHPEQNYNNKVLINQKAAEKLGFDNPLGKNLKFGTVAGVTEDFHIKSLYEPIPPLMLIHKPDIANNLLVKINRNALRTAMQHIKDTWRETTGNAPVQYSFHEDLVNQLYSKEQKEARLLTLFSLITVLIAAMGLFGVNMYNARQRTKEIGIRKVLGAKAFSIWGIFIKNVVVYALLALCIAIPAGYYIMQQWLSNFRFQTHIPLWIFAASGAITLLVAIATITYHTMKTANSNPVHALRDE